MSVQLKNGKTEIKLTKSLFKNNLTDIILELDYSNIELQGVQRDYWQPKHYLIKEVPAEFSIILSSNKDIKELTYYCHNKTYVIELTSELIK